MNTRILIAGLGNIFHGDDAFGVEVGRRLAASALPAEVQAVEFGIRSIDLAFALLERYDLTILVDAMQQGGPPGTIYTLEPDLQMLEEGAEETLNSHGFDPATVLRLAKNFGAEFGRILLVGCEPLTLGEEGAGHIGLSGPVAAAVEPAIEVIRSVVKEALSDTQMLTCVKSGGGT